jgi:hypothetical protein
MHHVSRALAWVRAMLFGPPKPGRSAARDTGTGTSPTAVLGMPVRHPSPEMWAAILVGARRRRAPHPWPYTEPPAITAEDIVSTLVGAYLIHPEACQRPLSAAQFAQVS